MENEIKTFFANPAIRDIIIVIIGIVLIWVILRLIQRGLTRRIRDNDNRYRTKKFISFAGYLFSVILITIVYSDKLGGLTVALGVAGAGIAFALQEVIVSVAGWLAVIFGGFYHTGDRVQLGGIKGDVIDIGVLRTTMMEMGQWVDGDLYNGRIVRVANSFVFKEPVFNYSADFPFLWDEITIPIKYGSDYALAEKILYEAANEIVGAYTEKARSTWKHMVNKYMIEDASTQPMVTLVANDNWVEFTLRYAVDYKKRRSTKNALFRKILMEVEASGRKVMFASATLIVSGG